MPARPGPARDPGARLASYQALFETARMLLGSATLDELLERITNELKRLVPYDVLTVYRLDDLKRQLLPLHCVDLYATEIMNAPARAGQGTDRLGGRAAAWPQNVPAAHLDPRIQLVPGTESEPETIVSVPLMARDRPIGASTCTGWATAQRSTRTSSS